MAGDSKGGILRAHPYLARAAAIAALAAASLVLAPNSFTPLTRGLIIWDVLAASFIAMLLWAKRAMTAAQMTARATQQDEGRHLILALCLLAAAASIGAITQELSAARDAPAALRGARIGFVFATIALSWTFTHLVFATHYAHEFYAPDEDGAGQREGLLFPGGEAPDFMDFLHFAFVIGVANQTADVQITSKYIRRTVTVHGVVAFLFNTVVLAISINFAASLFSPS